MGQIDGDFTTVVDQRTVEARDAPTSKASELNQGRRIF